MELSLGCCCSSTCNKRWTPERQPCNYSTIVMAGFTLELTEDPFASLTDGLPMGFPFDGEIEAPVTSWGGGPIGYFAVEASTVRLHRYCTWTEPTIETLDFNDLVQTYSYDVPTGKRFYFGEEAKAPQCTWSDTKTETVYSGSVQMGDYGEQTTVDKTLVFDKVPYGSRGVKGNIRRRVDIALRDVETGDLVPVIEGGLKIYRGTGPSGGDDDVMEAYVDQWNGFTAQFHYPYGSTNPVSAVVSYNDNIGDTATSITGIDKDDLVWGDDVEYPLLGLSPVGYWHPPAVAQSGNADITDYDVTSGDPPTMSGFESRDITQLLSRKNIYQNDPPSYPQPARETTRRTPLQTGRNAQFYAQLQSTLTFTNGRWDVGGTFTVGVDTRTGSYKSMSVLSTTRATGDTIILPFVNAANYGPCRGQYPDSSLWYYTGDATYNAGIGKWLYKIRRASWDLSQWDSSSDTQAVYAHIQITTKSLLDFYDTRTDAYTFLNSAEGTTISWEDWMTAINFGDSSLSKPYYVLTDLGPPNGTTVSYGSSGCGRAHNPYCLGTETLVVRTAPYSVAYESQPSGRWNAFADTVTFTALPGYTAETTDEQRRDLSRTRDDVTIEPFEPFGVKTVGQSFSNNWDYDFTTETSPVDDNDYAVAVSNTNVAVQSEFDAAATAGSLTRHCECKSIWRWQKNTVFGSSTWSWVLQTDGCGYGMRAVPPVGDGIDNPYTTVGNTEEGTCEAE